MPHAAVISEPPIPLPDLARLWGWSQQKLYRLVELDAIPHLRIRGRIYFEASRLEAWKAAQRQGERRREEQTRRSTRTRKEECAALGIEYPHEFS
jgi:hypothetical protein